MRAADMWLSGSAHALKRLRLLKTTGVCALAGVRPCAHACARTRTRASARPHARARTRARTCAAAAAAAAAATATGNRTQVAWLKAACPSQPGCSEIALLPHSQRSCRRQVTASGLEPRGGRRRCLARPNQNSAHGYKPPWPNGQGVGLLVRRLRVRVPQGVHAWQSCSG